LTLSFTRNNPQLSLGDNFLRLSLDRKREEMEQGWSSQGLIKVDLHAVMMVRNSLLKDCILFGFFFVDSTKQVFTVDDSLQLLPKAMAFCGYIHRRRSSAHTLMLSRAVLILFIFREMDQWCNRRSSMCTYKRKMTPCKFLLQKEGSSNKNEYID
jgi:hypothetical protein